jgi:hypothetical protein
MERIRKDIGGRPVADGRLQRGGGTGSRLGPRSPGWSERGTASDRLVVHKMASVVPKTGHSDAIPDRSRMAVGGLTRVRDDRSHPGANRYFSARSVADVLKDHLTLEVEGIDRMFMKWKPFAIAPAYSPLTRLGLPGHSERAEPGRLGSWCPRRGHRPGETRDPTIGLIY